MRARLRLAGSISQTIRPFAALLLTAAGMMFVLVQPAHAQNVSRAQTRASQHQRRLVPTVAGGRDESGEPE